MILLQESSYERAIEDCKRALELDSHNVKALYYWGKAECLLGRTADGLSKLRDAFTAGKAAGLSDALCAEITHTIAAYSSDA